MAFGLIIVGDEILSGRRSDKHLVKVIEILKARGLSLGWAEFAGDDRPRLTALLQRTRVSGDIVFSCGGIGATPDDHTRQAAAAAFERPLQLHPQAAELIAQRCAQLAARGSGSADMSTPENQLRLKMGEFPAGSRIIPNPVNGIPGFFLEQHYFVPGFPEMAWPMIEWALDTFHRDLFHRHDEKDCAMLVFDTAESKLTPLMEKIERDFAPVKIFSLPSLGDAQTRRHIELGVKGPAVLVDQAYQVLRQGVAELGCELSEKAAE